jgi:hypothetical protein
LATEEQRAIHSIHASVHEKKGGLEKNINGVYENITLGKTLKEKNLN